MRIIILVSSKSQVIIHVVIGPLILFFLRGFGSLPLDSPILDPDICWLRRLFLLLIDLFEIVIFILPSGLVLHLDIPQLPGILLVVQTHVFA